MIAPKGNGATSVPRCGPPKPGRDYAAMANSTKASLLFAFVVFGPLCGCHPRVLRITSPSVDPGSPPSKAEQSPRGVGLQTRHPLQETLRSFGCITRLMVEARGTAPRS